MTQLLAIGDPEIRPALRSRLRAQHADEPDTVFIEELGLCRGQAFVDLAVVNGYLHGYEIKSDRDSLRRLEGQVDLYGKVVDRATVVVGDRHLHEALAIIPAWWGVLRVQTSKKGIELRSVRRGRTNPDRDPRTLVELLWLEDALALLAERTAVRGLRGKPRRVVWDRVCDSFTLDEIATAVRHQLKARSERQAAQAPA